MSTTTCRVTFGSGSASDPFAVLELDDSLNLDADGQVITTFGDGQPIWFVLHVQPGFSPSLAYQTDGMITYCGQVTRARTMEGAVWSPEDLSVELSHYPAGGVAVDWQGNSIALAGVSGRTLAAADAELTLMARGNLGYTINCHLYRFDPPSALVLGENESYIIDAMITLEPAP
jgi:hypothetical protein